jgi:predicted RNase H-like HicB family nuclease
MTNRTYHYIVEQGQDGYMISSVIELPGCHSQAKTYDELNIRTKEAISLYLEAETKYKPLNKFLSLQQLTL